MDLHVDAARSAPEGRLWMAVLSSAFRDLERVSAWLETNVRLRGELAPRSHGARPAGRAPAPDVPARRPPTRDQLARQLDAAADLIAFFMDEDSVLAMVCDGLGYEADVVRERAEQMMSRTMLAERMAQARRALRSPAPPTSEPAAPTQSRVA